MPRKIHKKKGGCGCQNSNDRSLFMTGGNIHNIVNPINNYNNDPSDPSAVMSVRIQPNIPFLSGGYKSRSRKGKRSGKNISRRGKRKYKRKTMRKFKGGSDQIHASQNSNIVSSFNTSLGANTGVNVMYGIHDETMNTGQMFHKGMPFI
jgi:hypothetical protein